MSKKRSKILLAISILVITIFLLIQFIFQRSNLIPQLPTSLISSPMELKGSDNNPLVNVDVHQSDDKHVEKPNEQQLIPSQPIQNQVEEGAIVQDDDIHQPEQSSIINNQINISQILDDGFINEQKSAKPEETNIIPGEPKMSEEIKLSEPKSTETKKSKQFKIILWTDFFHTKNYISQDWKSNCDHTNCLFTSDRNLYQKADALMFHSADINLTDLPVSPRNPDQRWIYLNHESPPHTVFKPVAALNGLVNWTVTYRLDSDILLSPLFIPAPTILPEIPINHFRPGKVAWLVSNCVTASNREAYVEELKKHISVDIYGTCGNLTCLPKMSNQCYDTLAEKYFFYLSFENSLCPDYVTEKFFSIMNYPIVPVVMGGADYSRVAPSNSYIDALSFESPAKLAQYLDHLTQTPEEYDVYFNWKRYFIQTYTHYACNICSALNKPEQSAKTWNNLSEWWFEEATCKRWVNGKLIPFK